MHAKTDFEAFMHIRFVAHDLSMLINSHILCICNDENASIQMHMHLFWYSCTNTSSKVLHMNLILGPSFTITLIYGLGLLERQRLRRSLCISTKFL